MNRPRRPAPATPQSDPSPPAAVRTPRRKSPFAGISQVNACSRRGRPPRLTHDRSAPSDLTIRNEPARRAVRDLRSTRLQRDVSPSANARTTHERCERHMNRPRAGHAWVVKETRKSARKKQVHAHARACGQHVLVLASRAMLRQVVHASADARVRRVEVCPSAHFTYHLKSQVHHPASPLTQSR